MYIHWYAYILLSGNIQRSDDPKKLDQIRSKHENIHKKIQAY